MSKPVLVCGVEGCTWGHYSPLPLTLEMLATLVGHLMADHISKANEEEDA